MFKTIISFILGIAIFSCNSSNHQVEEIVERYEDGQIKIKKVFSSESDTINYIFYEYFPNGKINRTGPMKESSIIGNWEYYYENGQKKKEVSYTEGEEIILNFWLNNGEQTLIEGNGAIYEITDDGDSLVQEFSDYRLHGRDFVYRRRMDNNNQYGIDSESYYKNGLEHGVRKYYGVYADTDEERLSSTLEFKDGKRDGYWIKYYRMDTVAFAFFVDDLEDGISTQYYEANGNLDCTESWKMGVRHGIRKYYKYEGGPEQFQYFWEDELVGNEKFEAGKIVSTYIPSGDTLEFLRAKKEFK